MNAPGPRAQDAVFTRGSTMRHVALMSATGAVGLMAIFVVDLLSLLYISWLGDVNITAGVGYATTVFFFSTSVNIGIAIATGATVSRALGARDLAEARRLAASSLTHATLLSAAMAAGLLVAMDPLLDLLGAAGEAKAVAHRFLWISMPSNVLMALGMAYSAVLRAVGDARRAMYVTLAGAVATAIVDPILIFGLRLGADGAAITVVLSRLTFTIIGYLGSVRVHDLVERPRLLCVVEDVGPVAKVAGPAILTNIATPVANAYMIHVLSPFGDGVVAANAIMARLAPVAFGTVFALTGAVGPIIGQNLGARLYDRVRRTLTDSLVFSMAVILAAWAILALGQDAVVMLFSASGETADLVRFFCTVLAGTWLFHGALFVANAAFNNMGAPLAATAFNWAKATLGTIPFAFVGASWGPKGALLGQGIGAVLFGVGAVLVAYRIVGRMTTKDTRPGNVAAGA